MGVAYCCEDYRGWENIKKCDIMNVFIKAFDQKTQYTTHIALSCYIYTNNKEHMRLNLIVCCLSGYKQMFWLHMSLGLFYS